MAVKKIRQPVKNGVAKVPVVMQMEALECGAASLAMVMAYYDKWVPLEQVRLDCGVSRDGSNAKNVLMAARSYGFTAQGFRCEVDALKTAMTFPCIIHWNFNHFVVLDGFKGKYAYINDPARGEVKVPMEPFDQSFTGIVLQIEPGEGFRPGGKRKSTLDFARKRLHGAGAAVAFVLLSTVIGYLFGIINPVFSRFFMDWLLTGENRELLIPFLALMALMGAVMFLTAPLLMALMTPVEEIIALGASVLRIEAFAEPMFAAAIVSYSICVGAGDTLRPAIMNLCSMWGIRLTLAALLAPHYGLRGVWVAMAVELTFRGGIFLVRIFRERWMKGT